MNSKLKKAIIKSSKSLGNSIPILVAVVLLIGLANALIPKSFYASIFSKNPVLDSFIGSALGSVLAGNPVTSYILGGEFLKEGISLVAVTAFLVAWVTVGLIQLPAESFFFGKKFAIIRNAVSFIFSIIVAIITVFLVSLI